MMFETKMTQVKGLRKEIESYRQVVMSNPIPNASEMRRLKEMELELAELTGPSYESARSLID